MKNYLLKIMSLCLVFSLCFSYGVANANDKKNIYTTRNATLTDVPAGVVPMEFSSEAELDKYLKNIELNISNMPDGSSSIGIMATNDVVTVGSQSAGGGTVTLLANYGTTGDAHTGTITYISPYTQLTGFTFSLTWTQNNIGYQITSSQKDAYIYCAGVVDLWAYVPGGVKVASFPISIGRTCYLAR